jgi:SAM-dependent methyltransferase
MKEGLTEDVKRLYERYPYPYSVGNDEPDPLLSYLFRGYFYLDPLAGWRILDAGCGTGHKVAGLAQAYPQARFVGLELSGASAAVARGLAQKHALSNLEVVQGNILEAEFGETFDVVQSFGVVHHLEDPQRGLRNLVRALKPEGILVVWLYHPLGEFQRLAQRELLQTLWARDWNDMATGQALMEQLALHLPSTQYGPRDKEANPLEGDADAFMHPIVNAYRFGEALAMLRAAGMEWAAPDFVNLPGDVKLLNLSDAPDPYTAHMTLRLADVLPSDALQQRYRALPREEQLRVIELALHPRGFQVLAGRGQSLQRLAAPRMRGNAVALRPPGSDEPTGA